MPLELLSSTKYYSLGSKEEFYKKPISSFAEVWECPQTGAKSLHARIPISQGDVISQLCGREFIMSPNYLSVQIDDEKHILLEPEFLQFINHGCDPTMHVCMPACPFVQG